MAKTKLTDFSLPAHGYTAFDAVSLKSLIKDRLNRTTKFTGHNFEGSNMSALIDVIAYSYHVLLFYLNQTSSEAMFTEAELYENMNRIVKSLDYKPVGAQSPNLSFSAKATASLSTGTYTIPRYSFVDISGIPYSIKEDITFTKTLTDIEVLTDLSNNNLLYQGKFQEYPTYVAIGEDFETLTLLPGDDVNMDHFNIYVYVKDADTDKWTEWNRTTSLFLERTNSRSYEVRLNENKRYELKFGDNITGGKLKNGDQVAVYYLETEGKNGEVGIEAISQSKLIKYTARQFIDIFAEIKDPNISYISDAELNYLNLTNSNPSSEYYEGETVDQIRERAPKIFSTQHRLVTKEDYETYIAQNYSNVIKDVRVVNNWDYIDGHLQYNVDTLGLSRPNIEARTLYNQVTFADSCDFNNVYVYAVPRGDQTTSAIVRNNYLSPAQKNLIIKGVRGPKTLTTETIIMDPVYVGIDFGTYMSDVEELSLDQSANSELQVVRSPDSTRSADSIKNAVYNIFINTFKAASLAQTISVTELVKDILSLEGVEKIYTVRTDIDHKQDGLNLFVWNPIFPDEDIVSTGSNLILPYFKYPYINNPAEFGDKIKVITRSSSTGLAEY
tara:strand:+ start:360 stop:2195 length:1836 start_codon:yes stop_codon:yes gene_type:complete